MKVLYDDTSGIQGQLMVSFFHPERDIVQLVDSGTGQIFWEGQGPGNLITSQKIAIQQGALHLGTVKSMAESNFLRRRFIGAWDEIPNIPGRES